MQINLLDQMMAGIPDKVQCVIFSLLQIADNSFSDLLPSCVKCADKPAQAKLDRSSYLILGHQYFLNFRDIGSIFVLHHFA